MKNNTARLIFLGDICLNGYYLDHFKQGKKPFMGISGIINEADLVIGNLECFARGDKGENLLKSPRLETNTETLQYLKDLNLGLALLANNHIFDHLEDGFLKTINSLKSQNIRFMGASLGTDSYQKAEVFQIKGINFCILNYVTSDTNPNPPHNSDIKLNLFDENKVIEDIKAYRESVDHIILVLHWGGRVEGAFYPDWDQPFIAKRLIDAGADLIVGHHSHTVQPYEIYNGKYIFYSLGNFCFSDYIFDNERRWLPARRERSAVLSVGFNHKSYITKLFYFKNTNGFLHKYQAYGYVVSFRQLIFSLLKRNKFIWKIYFKYQKKVLTYLLYLTNRKIPIKKKINKVVNKISR